MSSIVTYKGRYLTDVADTTKVLNTAGRWLEDNITITDDTGTEQYLYQDASGYIHISSTLPSSDALMVMTIIPRKELTLNTLVDSSGNTIVDSSGNQIITVQEVNNG